jgi:Uma2 family endonuclease
MSATNLPRSIIAVEYAEHAHAYLRSLPLEHFMEATAQGTQRKITLESLDLVHGRRPEVQVFNELLVQYPIRGQSKPGQIVPDNMVVLWPEPIDANGSFDLPLQPVGPFLVMEYASKFNRRKDYEKSFQKYERELRVDYYLMFYPDNQELTLFHLKARKYRAVPPNEQGRHAIPELDLEVALLDGWVRFWYQGELLPLPEELQREVDQLRVQLEQQTRRAEQEGRRADREKGRAEQEKHRAEQEKHRADAMTENAARVQQELLAERQAREQLQKELDQLRRRTPD